jgi:hypothetical protein
MPKRGTKQQRTVKTMHATAGLKAWLRALAGLTARRDDKLIAGKLRASPLIDKDVPGFCPRVGGGGRENQALYSRLSRQSPYLPVNWPVGGLAFGRATVVAIIPDFDDQSLPRGASRRAKSSALAFYFARKRCSPNLKWPQ